MHKDSNFRCVVHLVSYNCVHRNCVNSGFVFYYNKKDPTTLTSVYLYISDTEIKKRNECFTCFITQLGLKTTSTLTEALLAPCLIILLWFLMVSLMIMFPDNSPMIIFPGNSLMIMFPVGKIGTLQHTEALLAPCLMWKLVSLFIMFPVRKNLGHICTRQHISWFLSS